MFACVCARACVHVCVLLRSTEMVALWAGAGGQRKQDANESAVINVCLISYSALSSHGKYRGREQRER